MKNIVATAVSLAFIALLVILATTSGTGLPVYGEVGAFKAVERSGRAVTERDLAGRIWVADFIFTHCAGPCPRMTANMAGLQKALSPEIRFVTFTVDPERDTPARMSEYAGTYGAEKERWFFLTMPWDDLYALVADKFHLVARKADDPKPGFEIIHSMKFALVDRHGKIRGLYDGLDTDELKRLAAESEKLLLTKE